MNTNKFANDGSFMEIFKRKMEEEKAKKVGEYHSKLDSSPAESDKSLHSDSKTKEISSSRPNHTATDESKKDELIPDTSGTLKDCTGTKKKSLPFVGKRRGGPPALKTGAVKKRKEEPKHEAVGTDAWSKYMAEVNKYKSTACQDEDRTRPLVK